MKKYCVLFNPFAANNCGEQLSHRLDELLSDCELQYQSMDEIKDFKKFFEGLGNNISECIANAKGVFDELTANARERLNDRIKDAPDKLIGLADEAANWTVKGNDGKEGGQQGEMQSEADER